MRGRSLRYQSLVKDERDEGSFLSETNRAIEGEHFLDFESTDSTAYDGDSGGTFDSIFNETDLHSPVADALFVDVTTVADADVSKFAKASADKFPCMSGRSAILLSEEESTAYYPNSPIMESSNCNERKTTKSYSRSFTLRRANQATSTSPEGWFSQVDCSIKASKRSSMKKNKNTRTNSNFSPLADEINGSTGGRLLFTFYSLFCFRKARAKNEF